MIIKDIWLRRTAIAVWAAATLGFLAILAHMAFSYVPPIIDITLLCNPSPASEQVLAYRFYERINSAWVFLGSSPTNGFRVTNVVSLVPHTYGVSASNMLGESDISAPLISPTDPHPPLRLRTQETNALVLEATYNGGMNWQQVAIITGPPTNLMMQRAQLFRSARTNLPPVPVPAQPPP